MEAKKVNLPEIEKIVEHARRATASHQEEVDATRRFADAFIQITASEAVEYVEQAKHIAALLNGCMDQEQQIIDAENRLADDLNDISVRYDAILLIANKAQQARASLDAAMKKCEDTRKAVEGGKTKLESELQKLETQKESLQKAAEEVFAQLLDQREKYAAFKVRRLKNGFHTLGSGIKNNLHVEATLLEQLERETQQTQDALDEATKITEPEPEPAAAEETKEEA